MCCRRPGVNMWVAEACNRPWDENDVNAYQYARDKFWKAVGGMHWADEPDFSAAFTAGSPWAAGMLI